MPSNSALPAYEGEADYVFICYSHADSTIYAEIRMLQDYGINVWYDSGITPGSEWTDTLARRIQGCSHFLYFVSNNSVESENCRRELNFAQSEGRHVVVIQIEDVELPPGLRLSLNNRQIVMKGDLDESGYRGKLDIALAREDSSESVPIVQPRATGVESARSRHVLLFAIAVLLALVVGFVLVDRLEVTDPSIPVVAGPDHEGVPGNTQSGLVIHQQVSYSGQVWTPRISPDGQFIAYFDIRASQIKIHDLLSGVESVALTPGSFAGGDSTTCFVHGWSPDSGQILSACQSADDTSTFVTARVGGSGREISDRPSPQLFWTDQGEWISVGLHRNIASNDIRELHVHDLDNQDGRHIAAETPMVDQIESSVWVSPDESFAIATRDTAGKLWRIYAGHISDEKLELVYETTDEIRRVVAADGSIFFLHGSGQQTMLSKLIPGQLPVAQP
ncbi:MAG: TIR domain-containing protein, partial [Gammaproteobacteria bacterium]|nr:TIR domain-containing protein [Gammaproteobacteria bacterium]